MSHSLFPRLPRRGASRAARVAIAELKTPIGLLRLAAADEWLLYIELPEQDSGAPPFDEWLRDHEVSDMRSATLDQAIEELEQYFAGARRRFDVPVNPTGAHFQRRVWRAVAAIPYGATTTYGALAARLGGVHLARAVGAANGANPIPIVIPCHRVLGSDGELRGYGGGLAMKRWLLRHEGALA